MKKSSNLTKKSFDVVLQPLKVIFLPFLNVLIALTKLWACLFHFDTKKVIFDKILQKILKFKALTFVNRSSDNFFYKISIAILYLA